MINGELVVKAKIGGMGDQPFFLFKSGQIFDEDGEFIGTIDNQEYVDQIFAYHTDEPSEVVEPVSEEPNPDAGVNDLCS